MAVRLTRKDRTALAVVKAEGRAHFTNGWRSAPGRPGVASGLWTSDGRHYLMTRSRFLRLRDAGIITCDYANSYRVELTPAGLEALNA